MASRLVEQLDRLIGQYAGRVKTLQQLREVAENDPGLVVELQDILLDPDTNGLLHPERADIAKLPHETRFVRVKAFFESKGNQWCSIRAVSRGTNLSRNSLNYVMYTGDHADKFEKKPAGKDEKEPGTRDIYVWRLKVQTDQPETQPVAPTGDLNGHSKESPPQKVAPKPKHRPATANGTVAAPPKADAGKFQWSPVETGEESKS